MRDNFQMKRKLDCVSEGLRVLFSMINRVNVRYTIPMTIDVSSLLQYLRYRRMSASGTFAD